LIWAADVRKLRPDPLPVEKTLEVNSLVNMDASFSPDGKWVAYSISRISKDTNSGTCIGAAGGQGADILIAGVTTSATKIVAGGGSYNSVPAWSPDGRYVAFESNREVRDHFELWTWEVETGHLRKLLELGRMSTEIQWTKDSSGIITTVSSCQPESSTKQSISADNAPPTVAVYESAPVSKTVTDPALDPWTLGNPRDLVMFNLVSGEARILDHASDISAFQLSPDGSNVSLIKRKRFERSGSQQILYDLEIVDIRTQEKWTVARDIRLGLIPSTLSWSPDSSRLAYQIDGALEDKNDCYIASVKSRIVRQVTSFSESSQLSRRFPPAWDSEGKNIYFVRDGAVWKASAEGSQALRLGDIPHRKVIQLVARDDGSLWSADGGQSVMVLIKDKEVQQDGFYRMDLATGQSTLLLEDGKHYWDVFVEHFLKVSPKGEFFMYSAQDVLHPPDLWVTDASFSHPHRLTHINPVFDEYHLGNKRGVQWLSLDGEILNGVLILPSDYEQGKSYPMIVSVYGGELGQSNVFGETGTAIVNPHLFATRGYAVLLPDAPQRLGTPMLDLAKTVLPGVNRIVEMGIADPKRVGLLGHSYGGYSVLSLLAQTPRFKAAVVCSGFGDLIGAYGQMDPEGKAFHTSTAEHGQELMGGTPWEYRNRYVENSPIFYLDRIATPLLIVHGAEDVTVAPFLADEIFVGMRRLGREVVYAKYLGEHHAISNWNYADRLDFCNRVIAWFDAHLK
jgi:dipeptidyl aminopeptidase/acylaminoacyl peptidase